MTKLLWIFSGILFVVLMTVIIVNIDIKNINITKKESTLPEQLRKISFENIKKPPVKSSSQGTEKIYSKSALLIDGATAEILFDQNSEEKVAIASTTKIMTALVILEDYSEKLNDKVTITKEMVSVEGSDIQLRVGETITVDSLLKGLLVYSGNDAAYALATYFGGKEQFVKKMNDKAAYLGLKNTYYKDPAGLNDEGYSTAKDLAVLATYAIRNKTFASVVSTPTIIITSVDGRIAHDLKNSNRMLRPEEQYYYPPVVGIKTGFTYAAGHCLVSAAQNSNNKIISVILNTQEDTLVASAKESKKLLEWGFANYSW